MQELRLLLEGLPESRLALAQDPLQSPRRAVTFTSQNHVRGIFFPSDRTKPEFIWVPCKRVQDPLHDDTLLQIENPEVPQKLEPDEGFLQKTYIHDLIDREPVRMNLRLDKVAPRLLRFFRDNFYNDGSLPTASLAAVMRPHGPESRDWGENLVVVAYSLTPSSHTPEDLQWHGLTGGGVLEISDVDLGDLRGVIDYSFGYGKARGRPVGAVPDYLRKMGFKTMNLG